MQLSRVVKKLPIILAMVTISSCSSTKGLSDVQIGEDVISTNTIANISSTDNICSKEQAHIHIQKNNIIYFDLDKHDIRSEFIPILNTHANFLRSNSTSSHKITIEGHADERGTPEYNISLGERRANAVKIYLQSQGVSSDQISIISYGKEKPAVLGHNESIYAKNRRAVLIY